MYANTHPRTVHRIALLGLGAGFLMSCDVHDNTINIPGASINATVNADVDVMAVTPGQAVPVMITVEKIYLIEPTMTPPPEYKDTAGHVRVYMDDTSKPELLITAQANFTVPIPADTKPGRHKIICRAHKHDGTPTSHRKEIDIEVKVTGTPGDASVSIDANVSTTDAGVSSSGGATGAGGSTTGAGGNTGAGGSTGAGGAGGA